jgi:hypothetical protein
MIPGVSYVLEKEFGGIALASIAENGIDRTNTDSTANVIILDVFI